jgi:hypothetical protein
VPNGLPGSYLQFDLITDYLQCCFDIHTCCVAATPACGNVCCLLLFLTLEPLLCLLYLPVVLRACGTFCLPNLHAYLCSSTYLRATVVCLGACTEQDCLPAILPWSSACYLLLPPSLLLPLHLP